MLKRLAPTMGWAGALLIAVLVWSPCLAAQPARRDSSPLTKLASARFSNLTRAERALLEHADVKNVGRAEYAAGGPSSNPNDSSNDPATASQWGPQREIRASLIRWVSVDPDAIRQIDPQGIRVLGAKIVGSLDLSQVRVPFAITLRNCAIPEAMELTSAEIPTLDLQGSYTGSIHAASINVSHVLSLDEVQLTGIADFSRATMDTLSAPSGHFKYAGGPGYLLDPNRTALNLAYANIKGSVILNGFEADGEVNLYQAMIGGDLSCVSGHFFNPGKIAIEAIGTEIGGGVLLMSAESTGNPFQRGGPLSVKGSVRFRGTRMNTFVVQQAIFSGPAGSRFLLEMPLITVKTIFFWRDVTFDGGAQFELTGSVGSLADQEGSWPGPGNLFIDGLTYSGFQQPTDPSLGLTPTDADTRLKWLALQRDYHPQPYRQLAKVLRELGDEKGAVKVLVAEGDARYRQMGLPGRALGTFLKYTIGYGHRPLLALFWSLAVVLVGWIAVTSGVRAGVMRATWPENPPATEKTDYQRIYPFLYSLDVFLPFVNLHQEHHWWPNADRSGECLIFGWKFGVSGSLVQYYLWLQIMSGWLLSAIFVAGITGLLRND